MMQNDGEFVSDACPQCGVVVDVTGLGLLCEVVCPACQASVTLRTRLDRYRLIEKVGQGGMAEVFRAVDPNLDREIALKVLHRRFSGNEEEQAKLAREARRTASVNHPNVVKVFNHGSSGGRFYLAMEFVPHGTLDELMELQEKIPEIQALVVAIQVAGGLQAALECDLIHRDIKPGNILFSDAATAKLVDFGLALVMDEIAAAKGEIWGTPYYVAPEKLDGGDEDFRSDIYSLGGTLFHALAGRVPYEAETASMVALKQLKSKPISLQTYAPTVSEETAYVVNRMMAKDPRDRYQSYADLIRHLEFSRQKILERTQNAGGAFKKAPVVQVESSQQRNLIGLLMVIMLAGFVLLAGIGYIYRDRVAGALGIFLGERVSIDPAQIVEQGRQALLLGDPVAAIPLFQSVADNPHAGQPLRNWGKLQLGIAQLLAGKNRDAARTFDSLQKDDLFSENRADLPLAGFFVEIGRMLSTPSVRSFPTFATDNYDAMGLFAAGLHNWANGDPRGGARLLTRFAEAQPPEQPFRWIAAYQPIAANLAADAEAFHIIQSAALRAQTPAEKEGARRFLRNPPNFKSESILAVQIQSLQEWLEDNENPDL